MPARSARDRDLWDPGAQPERTYQAWTRTGLALTVCTLFATRLAHQSGPAALLVSVAGALAAMAVVRTQKSRLHSMVIRPAPAAVLVLTLLTVLLAAGSLLLVAMDRP